MDEAKCQQSDVIDMLGTVAQQPVADILRALAQNDVHAMLAVVAEVAHLSPDFAGIVQEILCILHRIALYQVAPLTIEQELDAEVIAELAALLLPEDVQLYYQIALVGQRDLSLAPDPRTGFEMILLRMLAFKPASNQDSPTVVAQSEAGGQSRSPSARCQL